MSAMDRFISLIGKKDTTPGFPLISPESQNEEIEEFLKDPCNTELLNTYYIRRQKFFDRIIHARRHSRRRNNRSCKNYDYCSDYSSDSDYPENFYFLEKETPLHLAVRKNNLELVKLFLNNGADPNCHIITTNIVDDLYEEHENLDDGNTALHEAVCLNNTEIVKLLLLHGAKVNLANACKKIPLDFAFDGTNREIIKMLLEKRAEEGDIIIPYNKDAVESNLDDLEYKSDGGDGDRADECDSDSDSYRYD
jgi:ankyrin repeat protein